jgi:hypothetical protein
MLNISRVNVISRMNQQFEGDGAHLTNESGKIFVERILEHSEEVFGAAYVDLENEIFAEGGSKISDKKGKGDKGKNSIEARLGKLESETEDRRWNGNLLFARTREEMDTMANKSKEDRIIITGLTSSTPPLREWDQKKAWLRDLVITTLKKIKPDFDGKIGFINQGKNNSKDIPMVEVKLMSAEVATSIRKTLAEKRKEGDGKIFGRL